MYLPDHSSYTTAYAWATYCKVVVPNKNQSLFFIFLLAFCSFEILRFGKPLSFYSVIPPQFIKNCGFQMGKRTKNSFSNTWNLLSPNIYMYLFACACEPRFSTAIYVEWVHTNTHTHSFFMAACSALTLLLEKILRISSTKMTGNEKAITRSQSLVSSG